MNSFLHTLKHRLLLAWWAFRYPNNLTMLRHEMETAQRVQAYSNQYHAIACGWWIEKYLNLPVR